MSLIFLVDRLWLLEEMLLHEWKLCMMTFLITQRSNIIQTASKKDFLTLLTFIQTQNRIKRFIVNIMYRWILLSVYNSSFKDHEIIHEKENLSNIKKTLHMSKENILVKDFNLHHFTWKESFYLRQHLLLNELIEMITNIDASLALSQDTITRNYQESQMTINLVFTTENITNRLIWCEINEEMKNFSDHLLIQTVINLKVCKKSARRLRCNWKTMNEKKFINTLKEQMLESLLNQKMRC